jgi:hypothetical protein
MQKTGALLSTEQLMSATWLWAFDIFCRLPTLHYKKVIDFPVPSRDVTNPTLSRPGRVWLVTSRLGTRKSIQKFYSVLPLTKRHKF